MVAFHFTYSFPEPASALGRWLLSFTHLGWLGVHVFFVISGYCVADRAASALRKGEKAREFMMDRFLRIMPMYWLVLLMAITLAAIATLFNGQPLFKSVDPIHGAIPSAANFVSDLLLLSPWLKEDSYMIVSWTLTSEISFYLLMAIGIWLSRVLHTPLIPALAGLIISFGQAYGLIHLPGTVLNLWPEFICGILTWGALYWLPHHSTKALLACLCITGLGLLDLLNPNTRGVLAGSAVFSLVLIIFRKHEERVINSIPWSWLGKCGVFSYSLYLSHIPIGNPLKNLLGRLFPKDSHQYGIHIVVFITVIAAAWFLYKFAEQPLENWRRNRRSSR